MKILKMVMAMVMVAGMASAEITLKDKQVTHETVYVDTKTIEQVEEFTIVRLDQRIANIDEQIASLTAQKAELEAKKATALAIK